MAEQRKREDKSAEQKTEENQDKKWTTQYDKQKRVDQDSRTKAVTPYHRLVKKGTRQFTTEKPGPNVLRFKPK